MVKKILFSAAFSVATMPALAGGILTNTNQSISFLRMPAQEGVISVEGAYYNPAGVGFLTKGWHLAFNWQAAFQNRRATSTFPGYALGARNGGTMTKTFNGRAVAPFLPSLDVAYVRDKYFLSFHFGLTGGGGKAKFKDGLGSFESVISGVPILMKSMEITAYDYDYDYDTYLHGRQYHFGGQLNFGYKFNDHWTATVGGRLIYATTNYFGYVRDIKFQVQGKDSCSIDQIAKLESAAVPLANVDILKNGVALNCDQTGWGFTPVIGVNYNNGKLNIGARYEFKTRLRLTNKSNLDPSQASLPALSKFANGAKVPNDIPAIAAVGAQYSVLPNLRVALGAHYFFDKDARQANEEQHLLKSNSWEIMAGVEYDINDRLTASVGGQRTDYGLGKQSKFLSDISFVTDSYSVGLGLKYRVTKKIAVNVAYFKTLYNSYERQSNDYNNIGALYGRMVPEAMKPKVSDAVAAGAFKGSDSFDRTNDVFGIGVDIKF